MTRSALRRAAGEAAEIAGIPVRPADEDRGTPARAMRTRRRHRGPLPLLLAAILLTGAVSRRPAPAAELRFTLLPEQGSQRPAMDDLLVELDGRPVHVIAVDQRSGPVVIWLDTPLIGPRGLETAVRSLVGETERLVGLGPVDLVLADPEPTVLVRATRDPAVLEEALRQAGQDAVAVGELAWLRQRYLAAAENRQPGAAEAREAAARELRLIERHRSHLARWLSAGSHRVPGTLLLVMDGFDLEPRRFYLEPADEVVPERSPADPAQTLLSRSLAAAGWTVVAMSFGQSQPELADPGAALAELTEASAGRVVRRPKDLASLLGRLERSRLVTAVADDDGGPVRLAPLEVRSSRADRRLRAPRWATTGSAAEVLAAVAEQDGGPGRPAEEASRQVLTLLPPRPGPLVGHQTIETITGRRKIGRVTFLLDGAKATEDLEAPFAAEIDLGVEPEAHALIAIAYSRAGRELGRAALKLNPELDDFRVEITDVHIGAEGATEVSAAVHSPLGSSLESVEIFRGEQRVATLVAPPFAATFEAADATPGGYVRVVAHLDDGRVQEDARLHEPVPAADRIDVQLVELLAVVTRGKSDLEPLGPEDFTVVQDGRVQSIRQFAAAADLPLTLGLAIDTSESMDSWMSGTREAAARFLTSALRQDDRAFLVHFDTAPRLAQGPSDRDSVVQRLGGLRPRGDTVLYDGVLFSLLQFDRLSGSRRALVVLTDGRDEGSRFGPGDCLREAAERGVPIYIIALGQPPDPLRDPRPLGLSRLAHRTGGRLFYLSSPKDLDPIYDRILAELEGHYYLAYSTDQDLSAADLRNLKVHVQGDDLEVRAVAAPRQPGG